MKWVKEMQKKFNLKEVRRLINLVTEWRYCFDAYQLNKDDTSYLVHCQEIEKSISEILGYFVMTKEAHREVVKLIVSHYGE